MNAARPPELPPDAPRVVVVGAGMGGLAAAIALAVAGCRVTVLEKAAEVGGKMRTVTVEGHAFDAGPTVLTLRNVLERIFAMAGARLDEHLDLEPLSLLARHYWPDGSTLDLHADAGANEAAIERFSGVAEVDRFREFHARAERIHATLDQSFMRASRPNPISLAARIGFTRVQELWGIAPFESYWGALCKHFRDPRLVQLYGRYATYVGSSPFASPATLMLIAHVEQAGVWRVRGGMHRVAEALAGLAESLGVDIRLKSEVVSLRRNVSAASRAAWVVECSSQPMLNADAVVVNADPGALAGGLLGTESASAAKPIARDQRSLSAFTQHFIARCKGPALAHHTVFFSQDYSREFRELFNERQVPGDPTIYICAQDRAGSEAPSQARERLMLLINAPADGDLDATDRDQRERILAKLAAMGLRFDETSPSVQTGPAEFNRRFPGTGGALYGRAGHGWQAAFARPGARSALPGLYLAGGGVHPGAGVPMAMLSGLQAASAFIKDRVHA